MYLTFCFVFLPYMYGDSFVFRAKVPFVLKKDIIDIIIKTNQRYFQNLLNKPGNSYWKRYGTYTPPQFTARVRKIKNRIPLLMLPFYLLGSNAKENFSLQLCTQAF
jgi:hypothetical protein